MTEQDLEIQILRREIAKLKKHIAKVEAERDAAIEDIQHGICDSCIKTGTDRCTGADGLAVTCAAWEWRGV